MKIHLLVITGILSCCVSVAHSQNQPNPLVSTPATPSDVGQQKIYEKELQLGVRVKADIESKEAYDTALAQTPGTDEQKEAAAKAAQDKVFSDTVSKEYDSQFAQMPGTDEEKMQASKAAQERFMNDYNAGESGAKAYVKALLDTPGTDEQRRAAGDAASEKATADYYAARGNATEDYYASLNKQVEETSSGTQSSDANVTPSEDATPLPEEPSTIETDSVKDDPLL